MTDYEDTDVNDYAMAKIVRTRCSIKTVGGGDHMGDVENINVDEQFVWTQAKAELGWCLGHRFTRLAQKVLDDPEELVEFKRGVISCVDELLEDLKQQLEKTEDK
jgi:hypothetical protein